ALLLYRVRDGVEGNIPFVVPAPASRLVTRLEREAWRLRVPILGTPHSFHAVTHTVKEQRTGAKVPVQLVFFYEPDPKDVSKDVAFVFATNVGELSPSRVLWLASHYRDRWGIETGYREKDRLRVRTASDHYPTRLFLQLFSVLAYNAWTLFRAFVCRKPRLAPHRPVPYRLRRFRDDLVTWLSA
ncbi:MAG: hypothetical protein ACT4PT_11855, partial [Methanobacteriota archaeon]